MGTKKSIAEEYKSLWETFDLLLEKQNLDLSLFSKKWALHDTEIDPRAFYKKLKYQYKRKDATRPQEGTINQLKEYIKFLTNSEVIFEALPDEIFGNIF